MQKEIQISTKHTKTYATRENAIAAIEPKLLCEWDRYMIIPVEVKGKPRFAVLVVSDKTHCPNPPTYAWMGFTVI